MSGNALRWALGGGAFAVLCVVAIITLPEFFLGALAVGIAILLYIAVPRQSVIGVATVASFVVIACLPSGTLASIQYGNEIAGVAVTTFMLAGLVKGRRLGRPRFILPLLLYTLILLLGSFGNSTNVFYVLCAIYGFITFYATANVTAPEARLIRAGIIGIGAVEAALGIVEAVSGSGPALGRAIQSDAMNPFIPSLHRAQGTLGHPLMLSLLLLVALGLLLIRGNVRGRWRMILTPILVTAIVLTGSTSAILAAIALIAYWFFMRRSWAGVTLAAIVAAVGIAAAAGYASGDHTLAAELSGRAASHRLNSIASIPGLILHRDVFHSLFGNGLGGGAQLYAQNILINDGFGAIDNQLVTALAQTGIIGAVLLTVFFCFVLFRGKRQYAAVVIGFGVMAFSFDFMSWYLASGLFFAVAGISVGVTPPGRRPAQPGQLQSTPRRAGASA